MLNHECAIARTLGPPESPVKRDFYEKVTLVKGDSRFFFVRYGFAFCFGCDACCSPPCFYTHFYEPLWLCAC
jgi:hypothetical protein